MPKTSPLVRRQFIVADLETTGLVPSRDTIIEIGAILVDCDNSQYQVYHSLINPGCPIPPIITEITGITDKMVRKAPCLSTELPKFLSFVRDYPLIFHNAPFDMGFLKTHSRLCGAEIQNHVIDTLPLSRKAFPRLKNHKLPTLAEHLNLNLSRSHRSLSDCLAVFHVYANAVNLLYQSQISTSLIDDLMG